MRRDLFQMIKIAVFTFLLVCMAAGLLPAQPHGYAAVNDLIAFKQRFKTESSRVGSIESTFTQEKILSALTEKIVSNGKFWFKRSNRVKIEYIKPFQYTMVLNGEKMLIQDGQKQSQINVRSNKLFQQVNKIMIDCVQGTILESKDFSSKVFENDGTFLLELTPTSKSLREFFQTIMLNVSKADYSANSIEMNEPSGDKTTIIFTDKKLNTPILDAVFVL
ncbi:MAG: outer membrane lipoprotein carrier protein LolA [Chryseolinea sp.]